MVKSLIEILGKDTIKTLILVGAGALMTKATQIKNINIKTDRFGGNVEFEQ